MAEEQRIPTKELPANVDQWTVHVLNIHGAIFERWVAHTIGEVGGAWSVIATHYPVEYPPPEGPVRGHESVLDIRAQHGRPRPRMDRFGPVMTFTTLIECKKNNPEFIDSVFLKAEGPRRGVSTLWATEISPQVGSPTVAIEIVDLILKGPLADEGMETRGTYENPRERRNTETSTKALANACHQVALATQAIIHEQSSFVHLAKQVPDSQRALPVKELFLPMIVTTANLKLLTVDPKAVDPRTGTIPFHSEPPTPVQWLIYLYPLPRHLQFAASDLLARARDETLYQLMTMPILIVHSGHFKEFLRSLPDELQVLTR